MNTKLQNINWEKNKVSQKLVLPVLPTKNTQELINELMAWAPRIEQIYKESKEKQNIIPELEDFNFRVDSTGWKEIIVGDWTKVKINPEWDISEYLEDWPNWEKLKWEQLFTWHAAMRETQKAEKRIPTDEEFDKLLITKEDLKNLIYIGYRSAVGYTFYNRGYPAYFWSSTSSSSTAYYRYLYRSNSGVHRSMKDSAYGFSVRCIK